MIRLVLDRKMEKNLKMQIFSNSGPNILKNALKTTIFAKNLKNIEMIANTDYIFSRYKDMIFSYIFPKIRSFNSKNAQWDSH